MTLTCLTSKGQRRTGGICHGTARLAVYMCAPGTCRQLPPGCGSREDPHVGALLGAKPGQGREREGPPVHTNVVCFRHSVSGSGDKPWSLSSMGPRERRGVSVFSLTAHPFLCGCKFWTCRDLRLGWVNYANQVSYCSRN